MNEYRITTDSTTDFPDSYLKEKELHILSLKYLLNEKVYDKNNSLSPEEFYKQMRDGAMPTTSQVNPQDAKEAFRPILENGQDILHIGFSSNLSGSCNSAVIAANELKEEFPERTITVVDSLCASLGEGLLVHKALEQKAAGKSLEEVVQWLEKNKLHICHMFTVDDLNHLHRGGRVSKTAAELGTMVNIKPIHHVSNEGRLINIGKVRGRKKSLMTLVDHMESRIGSYQNDIVFISHGDCEEDARLVANMVQERFGIESFVINHVGPVIGTHSGPGTLALFFMGEER